MEPVFGPGCCTGMWIGLGAQHDEDEDDDEDDDGAVGGDDDRQHHHHDRDDDSYAYTGMWIDLGGGGGWR